MQRCLTIEVFEIHKFGKKESTYNREPPERSGGRRRRRERRARRRLVVVVRLVVVDIVAPNNRTETQHRHHRLLLNASEKANTDGVTNDDWRGAYHATSSSADETDATDVDDT
jgi:hypothetical protein